jgi:hypothetical protein
VASSSSDSYRYTADFAPTPLSSAFPVKAAVETDGIDARLERAKENIITLTGEMNAILESGGEGVLPPRLGVLAGESIYLVRSALDQLAWQLVIAAGGTPGRHTAFPIFGSDPVCSEESLARYNQCVEGMSEAAKDRIKRMQPYHRYGRLNENVLWILDDMSSTDQRQGLALGISTQRRQDFLPFTPDKPPKTRRSASKDGRASGTVRAAATNRTNADGEVAAYVSFARFGTLSDAPVTVCLWLLWNTTRGICASFAEEYLRTSPCSGPAA